MHHRGNTMNEGPRELEKPWFTRSDDVLLPRTRALTRSECERVAAVPGVKVDHRTGEVSGQDHALLIVAREFGCEGTLPPTPTFGTREPVSKLLAPFQRDGAAFLAAYAEEGALCHDDMGLGKTVQAIRAATMARWVSHGKLVLCPAFLRAQWTAEIQKWTKAFTGFSEAVYEKRTTGVKLHGGEGPSRARWVVAYYHDAEEAMELAVEGSANGYLLIFDEAHNLRGYATQRTESTHAAATFAAGRIALTGDLLVNNAAKLHPVLNLIQPGAFGSYRAFTKRYASAYEGDYGLVTGKLVNEEELRARMRFFSFRRTWDDIPAADRPFDTKMQTVWVDVAKGHQALRSLLVKGVRLMAYAEALGDAKLDAVVEHLKNDCGAGVPSLTFTLTKNHAATLVERLTSKESRPLLIHAEVAAADKRLSIINQYVERERVGGRVPLVVSTLGSLREGANLQWAKVVNFAALPFAPDEVRQGLARAARMGQVGTVTVRFFVAKGTGDTYFVDLMRSKLKEQLALAGKQETAKVSLDAAFAISKGEVDETLRKMLHAARSKGAT